MSPAWPFGAEVHLGQVDAAGTGGPRIPAAAAPAFSAAVIAASPAWLGSAQDPDPGGGSSAVIVQLPAR